MLSNMDTSGPEKNYDQYATMVDTCINFFFRGEPTMCSCQALIGCVSLLYVYVLLACLLVPSVTDPEDLCVRGSSWAAVTCMHTHRQAD